MCALNYHSYTHLKLALGIIREPTVWEFMTSKHPCTHNIGHGDYWHAISASSPLSNSWLAWRPIHCPPSTAELLVTRNLHIMGYQLVYVDR